MVVSVEIFHNTLLKVRPVYRVQSIDSELDELGTHELILDSFETTVIVKLLYNNHHQ